MMSAELTRFIKGMRSAWSVASIHLQLIRLGIYRWQSSPPF